MIPLLRRDFFLGEQKVNFYLICLVATNSYCCFTHLY
jgi:hypothetical protein